MSTADTENTNKQLKVGHLLSMDWKFGVAVKSSHCVRLNSPFVTLLLRVVDINGATSSHSLELSLSEFQEFAQQFKQVASSLEATS